MADSRGKKRKYSAVTCVNSLSTSYEWTLQNFSNLPCMIGDHIKSPTFNFPEITGKNFHLSTYPGGEVQRCEGYVSIYVNNCSDDDQKVRFSLILVSQREGQPDLIKRCTKPETIQSRRGLGWAKFIQREELLRPECHLIHNDTIVVRCEMEIILDPQTTELTDVQSPFPASDTTESLAADFAWLLESTEHADIVVKVENDVEFRAHKAVLAARSEVFRAMFHNGMQESNATVITLPDVSPDVFRHVMRYMYTGKVAKDSFSILSETLSAADRFSLLNLKSLCEQSLNDILCDDNAVDMLVLASVHAAPHLKDRCIRHIVTNFRVLSTTATFRETMARHPEIIQGVLVKLADHIPESKRPRQTSDPNRPNVR